MSNVDDEGPLSLDEAILLVEEIGRLNAELASREARLAELDRLAHRDPLVDLPNRRSFFSRLQTVIARIDREASAAALLFVDVDGLKTINDRFGHNAGDRVLAQVARLLVSSVRKDDFVARLAGDEFAILLEQSDEMVAWQTALRVVETIEDSEFSMSGVRLPLSVATGVGLIKPGDTPDMALARADKEMYRLKRMQPRGQLAIADQDLWHGWGQGLPPTPRVR